MLYDDINSLIFKSAKEVAEIEAKIKIIFEFSRFLRKNDYETISDASTIYLLSKFFNIPLEDASKLFNKVSKEKL